MTDKLTNKQVNDISRCIAGMLIYSFDSFGFDYADLPESEIERIQKKLQEIGDSVRGNRLSNIGSTTEIVKYYKK